MRHYCTLFDLNYLARGLALHGSLLRHGGEFRLHVLCLDEATKEALSSLSLAAVDLISIDALERWDPELRSARPGRSPAEFYFTCKPVLLGYLLERYPDARRLSYLDSDLFFFSDTASAELEFEDSPVALSPHRFTPQNANRARYGQFNAGWISVSPGREGRRFVNWWRDRCIEWCSLTVEDTRFGDQKYLDQVPALFPGTAFASETINLGPWNLGPRAVKLSDGVVTVAGRRLVLYHFHNMRRALFNTYDCGLYEYGIELTRELKEGIYRPYVRELAAYSRQTEALSAVRNVALGPVDLARRLKRTARAFVRNSAILGAR